MSVVVIISILVIVFMLIISVALDNQTSVFDKVLHPTLDIPKSCSLDGGRKICSQNCSIPFRHVEGSCKHFWCTSTPAGALFDTICEKTLNGQSKKYKESPKISPSTMRNGIDSLLLVAILSAAVSLKSCEGNAGLDGSLRRKRIANAYEVQDHRKALADSEFMLKPEEHLEDLWSRGTTVDEDQWVLKDRYLQFSLSLSMATRPPTPPRPTTPRPTPAPTLPGNGTFAPTSAPSFNSTDCLEGNTREQYVLNVLSSITDLALLQNASTPQGAAYSWLAFEDLETDVCEPFIERYGLATFYYSTSGDTWINNADWLSALDVCEWFGVTCDHITNSTVERLQLRK
jgi:hypothetical protein